MNLENQKAKLRWQCRRGMLELDLLLNRFLQSKFNGLNAQGLLNLEKLLSKSDPEIYFWLIGEGVPEEEDLQEIVIIIQNSH
jgi:antitoxin CptB